MKLKPFQVFFIISALGFLPLLARADLELVAPSVVTNFLALTDTPDSYSGQATKVVKVKADETGLEFAVGGGGGSPFQSDTIIDKTGTATSTATQKDSYNLIERGSFWNGTAEATHDFKFRNIASITANEAGRLGILWDTAERLTVLSGGKVGIAITSPASLLHIFNGSSGGTSATTGGLTIESSGNAEIQFLTPNINEALMFFGDPESNTRAAFGYSHANDEFIFRGQFAYPLLTVEQSGSSGFGTVAPSGKVHIVGNADIKQLIVQSNATQTANILEVQNSAGTPLLTVNSNGVLNSASLPDSTGAAKGAIQLAGQLGGSAASPDVRGLRETLGPTLLTLNGIRDGAFLQRVGTTISDNLDVESEYDYALTNVQVKNTTVETTVFTSPISANLLKGYRALRITLLGEYLNNSGAGATLTVRVKYGATTIGTFSMGSLAASANKRNFKLNYVMSISTATNAEVGEGLASIGGATAGETAGSASSAPTFQQSMHNAIAENSTLAQNFVVTVQHDTAALTIEFDSRIARLELI